ncbi:hypothetical protein IFM12275_17670 [Nocardia sputorum]|nr:hypothetical protein IFM12275_17670 [Nocardia sputorum]
MRSAWETLGVDSLISTEFEGRARDANGQWCDKGGHPPTTTATPTPATEPQSALRRPLSRHGL